MKEGTKIKKENAIIASAETIFSKVGFKNARMEEIAKEAGITKVTLYSYFQSKENLYLAITYKALTKLKIKYEEVLESHQHLSGLDTTLKLMETFIEFCLDNYLYSEALLEYFAMVRSTSGNDDNAKLTDAQLESSYYTKLKSIHNYPFKANARAIEKGKRDGSIHPSIDPMKHTLHGWTLIVGYIKVVSSSGDSTMPLFNVNLSEIKELNINLTRAVLMGKF